jgi:hypothetical protein
VYVWLANFVDELQRIRPHVTLKLANVIGRQEYAPTRDPKEAAAAYHARQAPSLPAALLDAARQSPIRPDASGATSSSTN